MTWRHPGRFALAAALGLLIIGSAGAARATRIRPGTISFGVLADYGFLGGGTPLAAAFGNGGGGEFRLWYRMRHGHMVGVTFGEQVYQAAPDSTTWDKNTAITAGLEFGQVFGSHQNPIYLLVGAGIWNPTATASDGGIIEANKSDRIYLSGTLGTQIFIRRTVAVDLSARGRLHRGEEQGYPYLIEGSASKLDHEIQFSAGVHFYVLD